MTKSNKSRAAAAAALLAAGFEPRGMLQLIGRARFVKPGTALRVRVGKLTTCFYEVVNGNTRHLVNVPTRRTRRIAFFRRRVMRRGTAAWLSAWHSLGDRASL